MIRLGSKEGLQRRRGRRYDVAGIRYLAWPATRQRLRRAHRHVWAELFADAPVKPSGGTMRVIDALVVPGMLVAIEMMAAR